MAVTDDSPEDRAIVRQGQLVEITRERLLDGSMLRAVRARAPEAAFLTDAELDASLDGMLAGHDPSQDVWLFGYGSLMWNPAIHYSERALGRVAGWHRRYCFWVRMGRGTPDSPGLMLALDRGGSCNGVLFRIAAAEARGELLLAWRREMFGRSYQARWVNARTASGHVVRAITFVADRTTPRYTGSLSENDIAERLAKASGEIGSCASYLIQTTESLRALGVRDPHLERLRTKVEALRAG
jgi:cation transport protein ChaC